MLTELEIGKLYKSVSSFELTPVDGDYNKIGSPIKIPVGTIVTVIYVEPTMYGHLYVMVHDDRLCSFLVDDTAAHFLPDDLDDFWEPVC